MHLGDADILRQAACGADVVAGQQDRGVSVSTRIGPTVSRQIPVNVATR